MSDLPEKIPQHRHCHNCGKAFVGDGHFCGDECKNSAGAEAKKKIKTYVIAWLAIVAVTTVVIVIYYMAK
jgi:predicted nucleic acid-binding Zn ribbon protein